MKKIIALFALCLGLLLMTPMTAHAEALDVTAINTLPSDGTVLFETINDVPDIYAVTLKNSGKIAIAPVSDDPNFRVYMSILDSACQTIYEYATVTTAMFSDVLGAGDYYVCISRENNTLDNAQYAIAVFAEESLKTEKKVDKVTLSTTVYSYNGKEKKPKATVLDTDGETVSANHYTITYNNNIEVGKGTATITFDESYGNAVVVKEFTIKPAKATKFKVTGGTDSYIAAQWKMDTDHQDGYELQYATNKEFKKTKKIDRRIDTYFKYDQYTMRRDTYFHDATYADYYGTILTDVSKNKTYYLRVRTYNIVDGKKIYSAWSKVQTVKTKGNDDKLNLTEGLYYDFDFFFLCFFEDNTGGDSKSFWQKYRAAVGTDSKGTGSLAFDRHNAMKNRGYVESHTGGFATSRFQKSVYILYGANSTAYEEGVNIVTYYMYKYGFFDSKGMDRLKKIYEEEDTDNHPEYNEIIKK